MRPVATSRPLTEAELTGVSCAGRYPQFDDDTGSVFSAAYSVPDHPPVMFDPPGISYSKVLWLTSC